MRERRKPEIGSTKLARRILEELDDPAREDLAHWATSLLALRDADLRRIPKAREALRLTHENRVASRVARVVARKVKAAAWTDRGWAARLGLGAAAVTATVAGGEGAGIAALGTAVGVPLWVVFGAGGAFAGAIIDEVGRKRRDDAPPADQDILDIPEAEFEVLGDGPPGLDAPPQIEPPV